MARIYKKKWFWVLLVIVAFGGYKYYQSANKPPAYQTVVVERGDLAQTVSVSSILLAGTEIRLNFETGGRIKDIATAVGKQVSSGDVVARLDVVSLNAEIERTQALLNQAEAAAGLADESLREARESSKDAKKYLDMVEDGEDQKVDAADKAFENAGEYEDDAQSYYDQVVSDDGASSVAAKSARLTLTTAENNRKSAEEAKETARRTRDTVVQSARSAWNAAREKVKTLESKSQTLSDDSAVAAARSSYLLALKNLDKAEIRSPLNGIVTQINYKKGEVVGTLSGVGGADSFGRLLSLDFVLEAKVPESDIASMKTGQKAVVKFDSFPSDETLQAEIVEIEPESTVIQDVVYYKTKLRLLESDTRLRAGMSADIDVIVDNRGSVLKLPNRSVKHDGATKYVEVLSADGRTTNRQTVETGLEGDEGMTEVVRGVTEGQVVIVGVSK